MVDLGRRILECEEGLDAGDLRLHAREMTEIAVAERVMRRAARALDRGRRRTDDMDHRHALGVAPGDAVDGAQFADAECSAHHTQAAHASVAVCCVCRAQFSAATDPVDIGMGLDAVEHGEGEIAGHPEHALDPERGQAVEEVVGDGVAGVLEVHVLTVAGMLGGTTVQSV